MHGASKKEYLRRGSARASLVSCVMGSEAAIGALKRGEVHVAGVHIRDNGSGEYNLPYIRRHLIGHRIMVVRFASWAGGLLVAGLRALLDTIASRAFRSEIESIGGYDTRETGNVLEDV